jgi:hypothetical protein
MKVAALVALSLAGVAQTAEKPDLSSARTAAVSLPELTVNAAPSLGHVATRVRAIDFGVLAESLSRAGLELPRHVKISLLDTDDPRAPAVPPWVAARAFGVDSIVIYPRRIGTYPYDSLESVFLHELVHLSLNLRAGGRPLPRWFHEGVALSVESGWGIGSQTRLLLAAARDPGIDEVATLFASETAPETRTAYLLSAALVADVRRRHGLAVPGAIASQVARGDSFETAFYAATGESVDEAAAHAWRVYRGLRWMPVITSNAGLWGGIMLLALIAFVVRQRRRRQKRWKDEGEMPDPCAGESGQE